MVVIMNNEKKNYQEIKNEGLNEKINLVMI